MATLTAKQKKSVKELVENFELDGSGDYALMSSELIKLGLKPNNKFIWYCINAVVKATEEYDEDFL